jgi:hypothetical protein
MKVKVRYDAKAMKWIPSRPSRIRYQTAKQLIKQYRQEYKSITYMEYFSFSGKPFTTKQRLKQKL